jgi:hypothetical protein
LRRLRLHGWCGCCGGMDDTYLFLNCVGEWVYYLYLLPPHKNHLATPSAGLDDITGIVKVYGGRGRANVCGADDKRWWTTAGRCWTQTNGLRGAAFPRDDTPRIFTRLRRVSRLRTYAFACGCCATRSACRVVPSLCAHCLPVACTARRACAHALCACATPSFTTPVLLYRLTALRRRKEEYRTGIDYFPACCA